jgi:hypothetical protein
MFTCGLDYRVMLSKYAQDDCIRNLLLGNYKHFEFIEKYILPKTPAKSQESP